METKNEYSWQSYLKRGRDKERDGERERKRLREIEKKRKTERDREKKKDREIKRNRDGQIETDRDSLDYNYLWDLQDRCWAWPRCVRGGGP